jgi:uncharacterized protein (DUF433 family)
MGCCALASAVCGASPCARELRKQRLERNLTVSDVAVRGWPDAAGRLPFGAVLQERLNMHVKWQDYIESTPDVLRGKPRIKGARIPVSLVLGYLAEGYSAESIIAELPDLTERQIAACLDYARELAAFEVDV